MYIAWTYLPTKKGFVTGLCLLATGLCPTLLPTLTDMAANPNNLAPTDPKYGDGFQNLFKAQAALYFMIFVVNLFLLPGPKKSETMKMAEQEEKQANEDLIDAYGRESYGKLETDEQNVDDFLKQKLTTDLQIKELQSQSRKSGSTSKERGIRVSD